MRGMARNSSARAPEGTVSGKGRTPRRRGAPAGKEWVRPLKRTQRMLDNAASMLVQSVYTVVDAGCCARFPIRSTKKLIRALHHVKVAARQYAEAEGFLIEAAEAFGHAPPELVDGEAAELLEMAAERCHTVRQYIHVAVQEVLLGHTEISDGVASGELVPEDPPAPPRHRHHPASPLRPRVPGCPPAAARERSHRPPPPEAQENPAPRRGPGPPPQSPRPCSSSFFDLRSLNHRQVERKNERRGLLL
jgi:hypothetical protein